MTARQLAVQCLVRVESQGGYSNIVIDRELERSGLDGRDRAFAALLFYGVLERTITLDACIAPLCKGGISKLSPAVLCILRLSFYQLLYLPETPQSAVVDEGVKLTRVFRQPKASGLVNALLRGFIRGGCAVPLPKGPLAERLSVEYSVPRELVALLLDSYGEPKTQGFLARSVGAAPLYLRVNTLKTDLPTLTKELADHNLTATPVEQVSDCLRLEGAMGDLRRLPAFEAGLFHVQDVSSQLCTAALELVPGQRLLDVCAAPGGKSFTAAQLLEGKGQVMACDLHANRVGLIEQGAARLGLTNITACQADATSYDPSLGLFERVLCDVPCSGLGIIRRKPEIRYKKLVELEGLYPIQHKILENSADYVAEGGRLIYSTCTLNPRENEEIVTAFLADHPTFSPAPLPAVLGGGSTATLIQMPFDCDGFFMAALRRTK